MTARTDMPLLRVERVTKMFRGLTAVDQVSFDVAEKEICALIGPNGAGKTTTFNLISGTLPLTEGRVLLEGRDLSSVKRHEVCAIGIGRTFQIVKPFTGLSVEENVMVGALHETPVVARARTNARNILDLLDLSDKASLPASSLTLPDRKRLEVARALATRPKILLLDEVMAGLRPTEVDRMVEILSELRRSSGITILLIEHVMRAVMALSDRVVVLNYGRKIAEGPPEQVTNDPHVLECYLGDEAADVA